MGVSSGIATDARTDLAEIQREIDAVEGHRQTAENAYNNLKDEAERLDMQAQDLKMQTDEARTAHSDLNAEADRLNDEAIRFRAELDGFESNIASAEASAAAKDTLAMEADAEANQREATHGADDSQVIAKRQEAKRLEMEAADLRADADDIRMDPDYIELKRDTEPTEAAAIAKRMEADAKAMEITDLQMKADTTEMKARDTAEDADGAKEHLDEIVDIKADLEESLMAWQGVVGDDATAAENEKAQQVLDLLALRTQPVGVFLPTDAIADLDDPDHHVFARAEKPEGAMTFEDIARAGVWGSAGGIFHTRSIVINDAGTPLDTSDDTLDTSFVPANHPAINLSSLEVADFAAQGGTSLTYGRSHGTDVFSWRSYHHGQLNGIDGTLYCDSEGGCSTSSNGVFSGGWYFTPAVTSGRAASLGYNPAEVSFEDSDNDGTYELVSYVDYGMWLEGADDALELHRRADLVGLDVGPSNLAFVFPIPTSATYTGEARGLSARTTGSRTASGHFEADVELVATFGYVDSQTAQFETPTLAGTIDNFRPVAGQGSSHVDTGWSIRLQPAAINLSSGVVVTPAYVKSGSATDPTGGWSATSYGDIRNERPDGFYGGFNTMFCDGNCNAGRTNLVGAAAGVYSAEKP